MTRWDALEAICGYLRAGLLGGERKADHGVPWELIVEVASFHYVTPALGRCLRNDPQVPSDVREYFDAMAALNGERNELMLTGLARTAGLLNGIGIDPILLKGCALLVEDIYPDPSLRLLGDVDVLIPSERATEAVAALNAGGFASNPADVLVPPDHHHLQMLHDSETGLGVELHTDVVSRSPDSVVSTAWFREGAAVELFRNEWVRLPEPTRNAAHVMFHSEVFHGLYWRSKIQLRHLLDLALIRARHENAIDWSEIDRRFSAAGYGQVLATYLDFAEQLFGQPAPRLAEAPRPGAMAELQEMESRDSFRSQIEHLTQSYDQLQSELSRAMVARDRFQSEAEQLRAALMAERSDRTAMQAEIARELAGVTRARDELEGNLTRLVESRSWKMTAPLRAVIAAWQRRRR